MATLRKSVCVGGRGKNVRCLKQEVLIESLLVAKLVDRLTRLSLVEVLSCVASCKLLGYLY